MYKNSHIRDLSDKLGRGEISPTQCLNILSTLMFERLALKEKCEAMLTVEHAKEAEHRMEMYKSNPEWFELRSKLIQCFRDIRSFTNKELIEQIGYLSDKDLAYIDSAKLDRLSVQQFTDINEIYKALEDLILIPKK